LCVSNIKLQRHELTAQTGIGTAIAPSNSPGGSTLQWARDTTVGDVFIGNNDTAKPQDKAT